MTHPDDLQQRYAEANALDARRPAQRVRDAALAHAQMVLASRNNPDAVAPAPKRPSPWAANLPSWKAALVASVLLAPLLGILVMRSERELPPGEKIAMQSPLPSPPLSQAADAAAPPMAESAVTPSARAPAAPAPARATAPAVAATTNAASPAVGIASASAEKADMPAPISLAAPATIQSGSLADSALQAKRAVGAGAAARAEPSSLNDALLQAVRAGQTQALDGLVSRGASVDARDATGKTALLLAVQSGDEASTKALLKLGANPDLADPQGVNALQLARQLGQAKIIALLENRRAGQP